MKNKILILIFCVSFLLAGCKSDIEDIPLNVEVQPISGEYIDDGSFDGNNESGDEDAIGGEIIADNSVTIDESNESEYNDTISIVMVGDILLHTPVEESAVQPDGSRDFSRLFEFTKEEISDADIAIVNEEVIIGGEELGISGYPAFNAPFEVGDALVEAGFDVVCHATNHTLDKGKKGVISCAGFWKETYPQIGVVGMYENADDSEEIYVVEVQGIKIAVLNYTYGTNGIALPSDMPYAVNLLEEKKVREDIARAEEIADFTIVCPHWGTEYELGITEHQKKWTKIFWECGADLVIGTHPHVIEPIELLTDDESGREMLVYYSLGNYVNWTSGTGKGVANRMVGGMAEIELEVDEERRVSISSYGIKPLICHVEEGVNGVTTYPMDMYNEELAARNAIIGQDADFSYEYCKNLCEEIWGDASGLQKLR